MDVETRQLAALATRALASRGLTRAPGDLAFTHKGQVVELTIDRSVYRGHFVTVHDGRRSKQQFRAIAGGYDWNAIARAIVEIAEARIRPFVPAPSPAQVKDQNRRLADELATMMGTHGNPRISIQPSASAPGRVRVRLDEVDLDPVSVMHLFAAVGRALPNS
ncbi:MAG TPA: hypothetical protein VMV45_12450 [Casimicrobiaceae bacterium]|nr:hypothetical protein [Casimicrobiaceae bacterium]